MGQRMRLTIAVTLLLAYLAIGAYYLVRAYQSAALSVAAAEPTRAVYQGRTMLAIAMGGTAIILGIILFLIIKRPERDGGQST